MRGNTVAGGSSGRGRNTQRCLIVASFILIALARVAALTELTRTVISAGLGFKLPDTVLRSGRAQRVSWPVKRSGVGGEDRAPNADRTLGGVTEFLCGRSVSIPAEPALRPAVATAARCRPPLLSCSSCRIRNRRYTGPSPPSRREPRVVGPPLYPTRCLVFCNVEPDTGHEYVCYAAPVIPARTGGRVPHDDTGLKPDR